MPLFCCRKCLTFVLFYVMIITDKGKQNREGENKMRKYKTDDGACVTEFQNITELVHFIETEEIYPNFMDKGSGPDSLRKEKMFKNFTETDSFEEAKDLLLHGWKHGTKEIKGRVEAKSTGMSMKQKTIYDVIGFQCSVPRYLQGIPTSMINKKAIPQKNKVITINKMCAYPSNVSGSIIRTESVKVLQLVNRMEKQGYRVNLNVIFGAQKGITKSVIKVCIKSSTQKLNIKQTAFPLIHPSMLRRIIFAVWERSEECSRNGFEYGYGKVCGEEVFKTVLNKGEYLIPARLTETEITDIEKYKVQ